MLAAAVVRRRDGDGLAYRGGAPDRTGQRALVGGEFHSVTPFVPVAPAKGGTASAAPLRCNRYR